MPSLGESIAQVRESVVAVMRIRRIPADDETAGSGSGPPASSDYSISFGSGFCVLDNRYVITAFHVLNDGAPPDAGDRHYVFTVPANDERAYHFPVISIPVQRPESDIAVLEIGPCASGDIRLPALPISFTPYGDGQRVLTVGFPSPEIHGLGVNADGEFVSGQFFLKSHANEGIVAAHYLMGELPFYELNVAWHNGESGGPIVGLGDSVPAFSLMQQYRNVQTPHGIVPGPRRGVALSRVRSELEALGIREAESARR